MRKRKRRRKLGAKPYNCSITAMYRIANLHIKPIKQSYSLIATSQDNKSVCLGVCS